MRQATVTRNTKETAIDVRLNLDGTGIYDVETGIGFLDHMLEQLSRHSLMDLYVRAKGDLHIDFHHTTEDTGIAIGEAVFQALGDRVGITRFGSAYIPMDETLSRVALDISASPGTGRPTWRIPLDAIVEFESRRSARGPVVKAPRRKQKRKDPGFITYF